MKNLGACAVMVVGLSLGVVAHAAPPTAGPTVKPGLAPEARSVFRVDIEALPVANKCGEPIWARVKLTNKTTKPWSGAVNLSAGAMKSEGVTLAAEGPDATKTVDVTLTTKVECNKPMVRHMVRVWKAGDPGNVIYSKALNPTKFTAERPFTAPAASDTRPWLRRVILNGTCGGAVAPSVHLHAFGGQPQPANIKLMFAGTIKEQTVSVVNTTPVALEVPGTLDCQAAAGIPSFEYALLNGNAVSGKLEPVELMFE